MTNIELPDGVQAWLMAAGIYDSYEIIEVFIGTEAGARGRAAALTAQREGGWTVGTLSGTYPPGDVKVYVEDVPTVVEMGY